jgi:hypothetical protein
VLERLVCASGTPEILRAHAAVTRAAHLRQVGGHAEALRWDGLGLALATSPGRGFRDGRTESRQPADLGLEWADPGVDRAAARVDALLGLAADALGLGEPALAARLLDAADLAAADSPDPFWRPAVRRHWVRAELALCRHRPQEAVEHAARALSGAEAAGAMRHAVKSALVLAVVRVGAGHPAAQVAHRLHGLSERTRQPGYGRSNGRSSSCSPS